ncbi:MAG: DNRLRE domain-containing protein [Nanoarchaeota archaeon]
MKKIIYAIFVLLLVGSVSATITGTVSNSSALQGVVVEAWQGSSLITSTITNSLGQYTLSGLTNGAQYTIRAYNFTKTSNNHPGDESFCWDESYIGYIPKTRVATEPISGINFNLNSFPTILSSQFFAQFYGLASTFNNSLLSQGDVVTVKDSQGVINGIGVNCWTTSPNPGGYVLYAFGDDAGTGSDEGAITGENINFFINEVPATNTSGTRDWVNGIGGNTEISTTGTGAQCLFTNAFWSQSSTTQGDIVSLSADSIGCNGKNISFTITEGGVFSRGNAAIQPQTAIVDFSGAATTIWTAEWVNDVGNGDTNPPEYYFIARDANNASNSVDSRTFNQYINVNPDLVAPQITNFTFNIFGDNVIITWNTNEPATSQIDYGKTLSYGTTKSDNTLLYNHTIVLNNLNLDTTYYYRVVSADTYNNINNSINNSFVITSPAIIVLQEGAYGYYSGTKDTYLYSQGNLDVGGLTYIRLGQRLANGDYSYPIFWFNTSLINSNATIISARLDLSMFAITDNATGSISITGDLYQIIRPWGDQGAGSGTGAVSGIVSWNYTFYSTTPWGAPGANSVGLDRDGTVQDSKIFTPASPFGWYSWNLNPVIVQNWVTTPLNNNGILIKAQPTASATRYSFRSSEETNMSARPRLVITFTKTTLICSDVNSDGTVNIKDLSIEIFNQGRNSGQAGWSNYQSLDLNNDSKIDWSDVQISVNRLGGTC